jgi:2-oxoglutarate dehydrogenase E1 component
VTADLVWAQEEPRNMGAWRFVREQFLDGAVPAAEGRALRYVGRSASASPAGGSHKTHVAEQEAIVAQALGVAPGEEVELATRPITAPSS